MTTKSNPGRPRLMRDGRRVNVYLSADALAEASRLGGGNVSAGIRQALQRQDIEEKMREKIKEIREDMEALTIQTYKDGTCV